MRRPQDVADMEEVSNAYEILTEKTKIKDQEVQAEKGGYTEIHLNEAWWEVVYGNNHGSQ